MGKPRLDWIDSSKGVSILLVVAIHSIVIVGGGRIGWLQDLCQSLYAVALPGFFFLSGFVASSDSAMQLREFVRARIIPPYWFILVWSPVVALYGVIGREVGPNPEVFDAPLDYLVRLLISPALPNGELWFLWVLIVCRMVGRLASTTRWRAAGASALLLCAALSPELPSVAGNFLRYGVFFFVGLTLSGSLPRVLGVRRSAGELVALLVLLPAYVAVEYLGAFPGKHVVAGFLGVGIALLTGRLLSRVRAIRELGRGSLGVYLAHSASLTLLSLPLVAISLLGPALVAYIGTAMVLAVIASFYVSRLLQGTFMMRVPTRVIALLGVSGGTGRAGSA